MKPMTTKREALERLRTSFVGWIDQQNVPDKKIAIAYCTDTKIEVVAAMIERFLVPVAREGKMGNYVELEIARSRALLATAGKPDVEPTPTQIRTIVMYAEKAVELINM